jgi:hypothetical protein
VQAAPFDGDDDEEDDEDDGTFGWAARLRKVCKRAT